MSSIKKVFYIPLLCLLASCANYEIQPAPWNNSPVPVVYSIITPGQPIQVYLNRTYNANFPAVKNPYPEAQVYMCGPDSNWVQLTRLSPDTTIFQDTSKLLTIEKGKTYSLKVVLANGTVHAQTTVIPEPGKIIDASCVSTGHSDIQYNFDTDSYDTLLVNNLSVSYSAPTNENCEYWFSAFSKEIYGTKSLNQDSFQSTDFGTPKDSTSFTLNLVTADPYLQRYLTAQSINSVTSLYKDNSPLIAILQSYGGLLPQFSNIVNGVGLFGNTVIDSKRVTIKPLNN